MDLDPKDRPSVPKLRIQEDRTGAHWEFPERQEEKWPRERSTEHKFLTPVFGTSCPPHGISGAMRRFAYRKYSEARAAHWLLLLAADRVDAGEQHLRSLLTTRPDNPITQTGVRSEVFAHGISARIGRKRADVRHHPLDPIIVAAPWVVAAGLVVKTVRSVRRRRR
ncbi:hypothetical protein [Actinophytocola gossypii]|uniref:hypothetical protein n=1 Tax=Actinophytocola gossypii TaxID=2812003 RepID=UPI0021A92775|nr:hypothetical protein [Actinophytocola gossypii]